MQKESRVKKTILNARVNLLCFFVSLITLFFTRKIFLDNLGAEFIGFTGTIGNLLSFLNLAELGIGVAIGYVLYKPIADGNKFKINEIISVFGYLYRIIGLGILSMGVIGSLFLPLIFPDTTFPPGVIYFAFYSYLASSLIGYFVNYRTALLSADQRNYIVTGYFQATNTCKNILQMVLAIYFSNFYIYIAIELIAGIINSIILNWKINKTYPWLKSEIKLGKQILKKYPEITKYTKQLFAHKIGGLVQFQLTPVLVYSFVSLPMVALYTNYTILTQKLEGLISATINSTGAAVGNLIAEGNRAKIIKIFEELLAIRIFIAPIIAACIYTFSSQFIGVWLGNEYILDKNIVAIIAILSALNIARGVIDQFIYGCGLFADVWAPYAESIIMVVFAITGGYLWGLPGVLCGPLASLIAIIFIWKPYYLFSKGFKLSVLIYWKIFIANILTSIAAFFASGFIYDSFVKEHIQPGTWSGLILGGSIYVIIIVIVTAISYYITSAGFRDSMHRIKLRKR
ncbi:MAG: sugar transporter [Bacteroidaceae bacterium]|nr:sugar transporter [Bacteroidaceae bacterium]